MMKSLVLAPVFGALLFLASVAPAQRPARSVNPGRIPILPPRNGLASRHFDKIVAAQQANELDMQGHAQHARQLLEQANGELRAAATLANQNARDT